MESKSFDRNEGGKVILNDKNPNFRDCHLTASCWAHSLMPPLEQGEKIGMREKTCGSKWRQENRLPLTVTSKTDLTGGTQVILLPIKIT